MPSWALPAQAKPAIINLLSRFYEINKGTIRIDGHDLRDFDLSELRRHIGVVLQDVFLFAGTIADNITLGNKDITEAQIWEAADLVGARRFIERLPGGLQYPVMERGATLSVGQRQLISFVRAMVYQPRIIILDEATSSVDTETEELIQEAIEKLMEGPHVPRDCPPPQHHSESRPHYRPRPRRNQGIGYARGAAAPWWLLSAAVSDAVQGRELGDEKRESRGEK